jgi:hypothetical protein
MKFLILLSPLKQFAILGTMSLCLPDFPNTLSEPRVACSYQSHITISQNAFKNTPQNIVACSYQSHITITLLVKMHLKTRLHQNLYFKNMCGFP